MFTQYLQEILLNSLNKEAVAVSQLNWVMNNSTRSILEQWIHPRGEEYSVIWEATALNIANGGGLHERNPACLSGRYSPAGQLMNWF
jgi:hypothetical protein